MFVSKFVLSYSAMHKTYVRKTGAAAVHLQQQQQQQQQGRYIWTNTFCCPII
jgi:hypothetical protein